MIRNFRRVNYNVLRNTTLFGREFSSKTYSIDKVDKYKDDNKKLISILTH